MQVKSIAECSKGSILQYFQPSLSLYLPLTSLFCLFLSGRLRQVLLYCRIGGGINERNIERILRESHATEFHCSARCSIPSRMSYRKGGVAMGASFGPQEYSNKVTDCDKVQTLTAMSAAIWDLGTYIA